MSTRFAIAIVALMAFLSTPVMAQSGSPDDVQVLTRGPVHEAFAETVVFDPEPGIIVPERPPAQIEEIPPDQRPEGDNVAWIPGYWAWDDSRNDFIWVSGVWRVLPPGREWIPGYWAHVEDGYQWIAGYWNDARVSEAEYLPEPPQSIEVGPSVIAPSPDLVWIPGTWLWMGNHYAWRPGYWTPTHREWEWVPAHYVWCPRGYVFVDGYWDREIERRGTLFAPVYFEHAVYRRPHYVYAPTTVININFFSTSLFVRPRYSHYYFGDYYAPGWERAGIIAPYAFHKQYRGYDTIYAHLRWEHREDRDWDHRYEANYRTRRERATERPPHTWTDILARAAKTKEKEKESAAAKFKDYAARNDGQFKYRNLNDGDRKQGTQHWQDTDRVRTEREKLEASAVRKPATKAPVEQKGQQPPPPVVTRAKLPKTQIVGKSLTELGKAAPPNVAPPPKVDPKVVPKIRTSTPQPARVGIKKPAEKPERHEKPDKPDKKDNKP